MEVLKVNLFFLKYLIANYLTQECGLPTELCEYSPNPDACKDWLEKNHPNLVANLNNLSSKLNSFI